MLSGLLQGRSEPLANSVSNVLTDVRAWSGGRLRDDVSLVAVEFGPAVGAGADPAGAGPETATACDDPRATARTAGVP